MDSFEENDYNQGEADARFLVFVYGSLKLGFGNSGLLRNYDAKFLGVRVTDTSCFDMICMGGFPAVVNGGTAKVSGELYEVDTACLKALDQLEGNGRFYNRELICLRGGNEPDGEYAWIYCLMRKGELDYMPDGGRYYRCALSEDAEGYRVANWLQQAPQPERMRTRGGD